MHGEVEAQGQHEVCGGRGETQTEIAIYGILPSKAGCRFSYFTIRVNRAIGKREVQD